MRFRKLVIASKPAAHWFGGWAAQDPMLFIIGTTLAAPLLQPPIVRNDPLLRVETGRVAADDFSFNARAFNGGSPGPTIIVRSGTQFTVTLQMVSTSGSKPAPLTASF